MPVYLVEAPNYWKAFSTMRAARAYLAENYPSRARDFWGGIRSRDDLSILSQSKPVFVVREDGTETPLT